LLRGRRELETDRRILGPDLHEALVARLGLRVRGRGLRVRIRELRVDARLHGLGDRVLAERLAVAAELQVGAEGRAARDVGRGELRVLRKLLLAVGPGEVEAGELAVRVAVLRPELNVVLERRDRLVRLAVRLERRREIAVPLRLLRMLANLLLRRR